MIGVDIVDIKRVARAARSEHFLSRVFTVKELEYYESTGRRDETLAGFFCAKEAVFKALGSGISGLNFHDVEIDHLKSGAPVVHLYGKAGEVAAGYKAHVSISHDAGTATAVCMLEVLK